MVTKKGPQRKNVRAITVKPLTMSMQLQIYKYLIKFIFLIKLIKLILFQNPQHGKKHFPRFGFQ